MGQSSTKWMLLILSSPVVVAFIAALASQFDLRYLSVLGLAIVGCSLILFAKLRQKMRTGKIISFNLQGMSVAERGSYLTGYGLYFVTIVLCIYLKFS